MIFQAVDQEGKVKATTLRPNSTGLGANCHHILCLPVRLIRRHAGDSGRTARVLF